MNLVIRAAIEGDIDTVIKTYDSLWLVIAGKIAIRHNQVDIVKYVAEIKPVICYSNSVYFEQSDYLEEITTTMNQVYYGVSVCNMLAKEAALYDRMDILEMLGKHDVLDMDLIASGAAQGGHLCMLKRSIKCGAKDWDMIGYGAALGSQYDIVKKYMNKFTDVDSVAMAAAQANNTNIIMLLLDKVTSLDLVACGAARGGHKAMIDLLTVKGARNFFIMAKFAHAYGHDDVIPYIAKRALRYNYDVVYRKIARYYEIPRNDSYWYAYGEHSASRDEDSYLSVEAFELIEAIRVKDIETILALNNPNEYSMELVLHAMLSSGTDMAIKLGEINSGIRTDPLFKVYIDFSLEQVVEELIRLDEVELTDITETTISAAYGGHAEIVLDLCQRQNVVYFTTYIAKGAVYSNNYNILDMMVEIGNVNFKDLESYAKYLENNQMLRYIKNMSQNNYD